MPTAYKLTIKKFIEFIHNHTHKQTECCGTHTHTHTHTRARISRQQKRPLGVLRIPVFVAQCKRQNKLKLKFMIFYDLLTGIFSFLFCYSSCECARLDLEKRACLLSAGTVRNLEFQKSLQNKLARIEIEIKIYGIYPENSRELLWVARLRATLYRKTIQ